MHTQKRITNSKKTEYYMYGAHAVLAAINNPKRNIGKIYCLPSFAQDHHAVLKKRMIEIVSNDFITKKIGNGHPHQGVIALAESIFGENIEELDFSPAKDRVVILDQLSDPQNIGAIIRSATAFGINKLILPKDNAPDENASIAKAASGCLEFMQVVKVTNIKHTIKQLQDKGFWILGLDAHGQENLKQVIDIEKIAIIIGSEGKGMRKLTSESCDFLVKIPIHSQVESLNASNAASIIFYLLRNI